MALSQIKTASIASGAVDTTQLAAVHTQAVRDAYAAHLAAQETL